MCISRHSSIVPINPSIFWPCFTLLTFAFQSPDDCRRYDLHLLCWDCLTPPPHLIHPLENPNALILRGNIYIYISFTIYLAMIYWLRLPPSQRITDPFWEIRFSHLSWVSMWCRSLKTVWGETDFEEQQCVTLHVVTPLLPIVYAQWIALWFSAALSIVLHYLLLDK